MGKKSTNKFLSVVYFLVGIFLNSLAANVWVWAVAGLGGLSNVASRNAKAD